MQSISVSKKGFSIVELLIVIVILGILSAVAIPNYLGAKKKAVRAEAKSNLESLALALEQYYAVNGNYGTDGNYTYCQTEDTSDGCYPRGWNSSVSTYLNAFKPGNKRSYDYRLTVSSSGADYLIKALPKTGTKVDGDLQPWIDQNNNSGPNGFW